MIPSVLLAVSRSLRSSDKFIAIQIFYLNVSFFKNDSQGRVFRNANLSNSENVLHGNLRTERTGSAFLEHLKAQILKISQLVFAIVQCMYQSAQNNSGYVTIHIHICSFCRNSK